MAALGQPFDVLEHEIGSVELADDAHEIADERVPRIIQRAVTNERKTLTGCTPEDDVHRSIAYAGQRPNLFARHLRNGPGNDRALREVEFVDSRVNRIDLNGRRDVKTSLLKAQAQSASTSE